MSAITVKFYFKPNWESTELKEGEKYNYLIIENLQKNWDE